MKILLIAGGSPSEWPDLTIGAYDYIIGIDRGGLYAVEHGWMLHLAVGDFDSLNESERQVVFDYAEEITQVKAEKDDTDTQLALASAVDRFPHAQITLIGTTGGRVDHFLSNLWLPLETRFLPFVSQIEMKDKQNSLRYYGPGSYMIQKEKGMKYMAYCCLTPVDNLTLADTKYTLDKAYFEKPTSLASNEFMTDYATFSFDSGVVLVVQSRDDRE